MRVAVFGLGYVGAVTAACLAAEGHDVWGVDVDPAKVATVASGRSPVSEPGLDHKIAEGIRRGRLHAVCEASVALKKADVSLLCVGTPSAADGGADLRFIDRVIDDLAASLKTVAPPDSGFHSVVMRSTVPPGTVDSCGRALAEKLGNAGPAVGVAMCPEFLREGTGVSDFYAPPATVIGTRDSRVSEVVGRLFAFLEAPVRVVDTKTAEALKYACNAFHATKVSFANEIGRVFRQLGIDSREVMELFCQDTELNISAKYLRPGFAFGGSCLPKDVRSLLHLARMRSVDLPQLVGTLETNRLIVREAVDRVIAGDGRRIALLGLSFKQHSDDLRESPYVDLAETLIGKGCDVRIYDPIINPSELIGSNRAFVESKLPHLGRLLSRSLSEALSDAETVLVSYRSPELIGALLEARPPRLIDLHGGLGAEVESLPGYEGACW